MRKGLLITFAAFFLLFLNEGCLKNNVCNNKSVDSERGAIMSYASANGITATEHSSGIFYQITNSGIGPTPTANSTVSVKYIGKLTSGTIFDDKTAAPVSVPLNQVIKGWQNGIPLIQKGGSIKLIVPSSLGYGCTGFGAVPENSILYFEIELVDVF